MDQSTQVFNILLGLISLLAIISGFLIKEYQIALWSIGLVLLVFITLGYYVVDNRNKLNLLITKFKRIEESLNIYNRLNRLELKMKKRGEIDLLDLIKIGIAIILIIVLIQAIRSLL